ncbi:DUF1501 domain-containing protein [Ramlibacter sp. MMS24-I3-19]|uniref:DUF1501 domain-containing protein n=1 Tax=Ramlibacter sp. MMS24-I3-19 TaxID=3416606 RepID=UPI003D05ED85
MLSRRHLLVAGASPVLAAFAPRVVFAQAATERRFVFIIQRGAADGLSTVVPYADPAYASLRGPIAMDPSNALKLDGLFALHPALQALGAMHQRGEALFVHAVASPYRDRSHFDAQNVLESGGTQPYQLQDGWMNRLLRLLPRRPHQALAFAPTVPLALRGAADVSSYAPSALPSASDDLLQRVQQLYAGDAQLHALWSAAMDARGMAGGVDGRNRQDPAELGRTVATFLAAAEGPRLAMIETGGWDTHSAQVPRLQAQLTALDRLLEAMHTGLGDAWRQTVVLVATEFGRTAAANGTGGTDHGTGSVAMLAGGAVHGGRVLADWPGLAPSSLYQGRDLQPTTSLATLIAQAGAETFGLDAQRAHAMLFPSAPRAKELPRLLRT